jgi:hypothetical protein
VNFHGGKENAPGAESRAQFPIFGTRLRED